MLTIIKDSETTLITMMNSLKDVPQGYYALHFHFSKLHESSKSEFQIKIALNVIHDLFKDYEGGVFLCTDSDIIVVYEGDDRSLLEKVIFQLRYLLMDDPLAYSSPGVENEEFCSVYMLEFQWRDFLIVCKKKLAEALEAIAKTTKTVTKPAKPLTPSLLTRIENELKTMDLSQIIRAQAVCAAVKSRNIKPIFDEIYVNIPHLRQLIGADINITSNKTLFRYLTELLDKNVLTMLRKKHFTYLNKPVSINLNIESFFTDEFEQFDMSLQPKIKSSIIFEIHVSDVFSDIASFNLAKDYVKKVGYRVCLDGLNAHSFMQVNRAELGFDLAKVQWNADLESALGNEENQRLYQAIQKCGQNRVILCRCDSQYAIDYGHALGISLFQGRYIDQILNPTAKVIN